MPRLHFVRHGQASFGAKDYDNLSEIGHLQSKVLGKAMWREGAGRLYSGTLKRHCQTAEGFAAGVAYEQEPRWNEFDYLNIIGAMRPEFDSSQAIGDFVAKSKNPNLEFQAIYDAAVQRWADGENDQDYNESRSDFRLRIRSAIDDLANSLPKDGTAFVFSSGGPISAVVQEVMDLSETTTRQVERVLHNASVTTISVSSNRTHMIAFNQHHHLEAEDAKLITHR
ncbi:histidine phosphatase family protein [Hirschia baltica]|uniref:Phosphoglycerate mutase n=1 Tax=Hirschia baltica (strain ATCC 49814 / DSM 5838 / IFAM 1418) TaxID=582402 RepID=C6XR01_HIRBI|nr:histidine phosphatase family protein [Hirschia baltica]ACT60532.1 Phosphoglycerate mutase [Hirschia baltica ATCC 49814]